MENNTRRRKREVPICERAYLTVKEEADYTGIGENRLRMLAAKADKTLVLYVGTKILLNRKRLDMYLEETESI